MKRLYWRIFLSFWAVIVVTTAISMGMTALLLRDDVAVGRAEALRGSLGALSEQAQRVLDRQGKQGLRDWLAGQQGELPTPLLLLDAEGRDLLDRPLPPGMQEFLRRQAAGPQAGLRRPRHVIVGPDGAPYRLVVPRGDPRFAPWFQRPGSRLLYLAVLLLVSGLVCLLLARHITRPVRALRNAGQAIAAGALDARVGPEVGRRRDELGALARDFDRMAERVQQLLESRQRLLRDVSHELRSPLGRLQVAAGLLRQRGNAGSAQNLDRIEQEVANLDGLIGRILDFARLETVEAVRDEPVDLAELCDSVAQDAMFEGRGRGLEVRVAGCRQPLHCAGDAELLRSAVENVVRNALQHARHGVDLSLQAIQPGWLQISVADDGPGVTDDELPRLFEPFFTGQGRGAGIGLAIARRAVQLHGGRIQAANSAEGGLKVDIDLPGTG